MSDLIKKSLTAKSKKKALLLCAEILSMHGSVAGSRVCQDWSGSEEFNPEKMFTENELQDIAYNYEIENSQLDDYCPEYHGMHDEMVASFAMAEFIKDMASEIKDE